MKAWTASVADAIRAIPSDEIGPRLQREFIEAAKQPLNTRQLAKQRRSFA